MIKFFRKIRLQLLTENKFNKYLIYAIGEIILVVIGILIALQINNYNENKKERKKEQIVLISLREDFIMNKEIIEIGFKKHISDQNGLREYIKHLGPNVPPLTDSIYNNYKVTSYGEIEIIDGALISTLNSNNLEIITNEKLKRKLTSYLSTYRKYKSLEEINKDIVINKFRSLSEKYTSIIRQDSILMKISKPHKSDFLGWARDPKHQNNTVNRIRILNSTRRATQKLYEENEEILSLLKMEIKSSR